MRHNPGYGIMRKFVERRSVIARRVFERLAWRQVDAVAAGTVEGAIHLVVADLRAGVGQDALTGLSRLECAVNSGLVRRDAIDLFGIEDGVDAVDQARLLTVRLVFALRVAVAFSGFLHLPELDLRALLALSDLPALLGSLAVGHPSRVLESASDLRRHQVNRIAAPVRLPRGGVLRNPGRLPRLLPWRDTFFEHPNDGVGNLLPEVPLLLRLRLSG
jgi:hypothetical protein